MAFDFLQTWHLIGTVSVLLIYPYLFAPPLGINKAGKECEENHNCDVNILMTAYYCVFSGFYSIFYAFVQISHLAMIPELTSNEHQSGFLTTMRNIGRSMSNIFVCCILWIMLGKGKLFDSLGLYQAKITTKIKLL